MRPVRAFAAAIALTAGLIGGAAVAVPSGWATAEASTQATSLYDSAVLADSPLFYWPLNETSGAVRDLTGHAAASTVTTAQLGVTGSSGTAAAFDGISQQIQVPYTASMQLRGSFSAEVWAKLPASPQTSGWPTIFSRGNMTAGHFGTAMWASSDSTHAVYFKRNGYDLGTARGLTATAYRHLVFTWDNTAQRWSWYVDGTLDTSGVLSALSGVDTETAPLAIGTMLASAGATPVNYGKLQVDGLALYGSVLPASRIAAHYAAAGSTGPAAYVGGVAVGGLQPWNTRRAADYKAMAAAHASWIRSDFAWEYLEQSKGSWHWDLYDPVVADTVGNGMRYLGILHTVPSWANGNAGDYAPPGDLSLETNYCYQVVKHYLAMGVTDYEIGNEVNLPHPGWSPSGATYESKFLAPCVSGVRQAATELGKKVTTLFGSMAPTDWTGGAAPATFLTDAYNAGAQGLFDAVAWHPYTGADLPSASTHMNADPANLYSIMSSHGDAAKKLWATEYGMPTGGSGSVTEQVQTQYVNNAFDTWYAKPYAGPLFWYSARDTGTSTTDREQHFGVLRYDGSAKPAYGTLATRLTR